MKYLNKNIEEFGKVVNNKNLIHHTTTCGIFKNAELNSPKVKHYLQNHKTEFSYQ